MMKNKIRVFIAGVAIVFCGVFCAGKSYSSGIPVFDATNIAHNLLTAERMLEQIDNQLKMLESLNFDASGDITQLLDQTRSVLNQVEGIAYDAGQISDQFVAAYPESMDGMSYDDLVNMKDNLLLQTRNAQQHAMEVQAGIAGSIPQTQGTVADLVSQSNSASGATAAIQANTQLLATMSAQLTQMQSLLMSQTRALNVYIQEQNTRASAAVESQRQIIGGVGGSVETGDNGDELMSFESN